MKSYTTERLRNVGLFSHGGAGKTSLAEAMLFASGAINRLGRVEEGTTVSDYDPEEIKRHISVNLSLLPIEWKGNKINLIDTPGYADFVGEVKETTRVVDAAIIVFCAVAGVEVGSELVWKYADERKLPRLAFIGRMDRENADFHRALAQLQSRFGKSVVPIQLPIGSQENFKGVVDLVRMKAYVGPKGEEAPVPEDLKAQAEAAREKLVEAAAETDDELIIKYLEGEPLTEAEIARGLRAGVLAAKVVPVLCGTAIANKAIPPLLEAIVDYLPSPLHTPPALARNLATGRDEALEPRSTLPLAALVFKTTADPYVGKLTYFRVYSGTIHSDSRVYNSTRNTEERIGQLFVLHGKSQEPVVELGAGEVGAVAKLAETATGNTLCTKDHPVLLPGIEFPAPSFTAAVQPKTKADLDKLGAALARLAEEDSTISITRQADTAETLIAGMGESHVEIAAERMRRKFGVDVTLSVPKIPYKETILSKVNAEYRHKKQTGGHGQYGHVFLELEPLPRGSGVEFAERVVGGAVPKNYIPAVEKGVKEAFLEGQLAGYPITDLRVTLYDGSYHPVDSSEMSFKLAAIGAIRKGMSDPNARPVLLEPIVNLTITVPEQYTGDVIGDLNSKRARVLGMEPKSGLSVISAQAPLAEVQRYATDLRSITQGRGIFSMESAHYEEVPGHIAQGIIEQAKKEREAAQK
ncbi:MAG: elongation factor G [Chloroflexota bacterium]